MTSNNTQLSIIVLNHNTKDFLARCLNSIHPQLSHEIIVVDNASTDGSVAFLHKQFPEVKVIKSSDNNGFAAGNNLGLRQAKGKYLMLLSSDTVVEPEALERLIKYLDKHKEVGIVSPVLILSDGRVDMACHRGFPTPFNALFYFSGLAKRFPKSHLLASYHQTWHDMDTVHQVDAVSGAAMIFRHRLMGQIGELDERFFMYAEDIDFCYRAKSAGWRVVYYPKAKIIHFKGASGSKSRHEPTRSRTRQFFYHTMKQYFRKHYSNRYPKFILHLIDIGIDILSRIRG